MLYSLGLTDLANEGIFQWETDFKIPDYTNWYTGQPDSGNSADCVILFEEKNHQWWDTDCHYVKNENFYRSAIHALCEKPNDQY